MMWTTWQKGRCFRAGKMKEVCLKTRKVSVGAPEASSARASAHQRPRMSRGARSSSQFGTFLEAQWDSNQSKFRSSGHTAERTG